MHTLLIKDLETAINAAREAEKAPEYCLSADVRCLANLYGDMIYARATERAWILVAPEHRAIFDRWSPSNPLKEKA